MNRPPLSVITTTQEEPFSKTGTQPGAHGLATLVGLQDLPKHPDPETALHIMACLQAFSARQVESQIEADETREAILYLQRPAPRKWIAGRIVTLLSHYFVAQQEAAVADAVAEDWCAMLEEYPAWALANACRWWMSRENPRRHCKPMPGDIQDRAHAEMSQVRAAQITLGRGIAPPPRTPSAEANGPEGGEWWTEEARERRRAFAESVLRSVRGAQTDEAAQ